MQDSRTFFNASRDRRLRLYRDECGAYTYLIEEYVEDEFDSYWTPESGCPCSWFNDMATALAELTQRYSEFVFELDKE